MHLRLNWPGLITGFGLAPANVHDLAMVPELAAGAQGVLLGDRNYWSPTLAEELHSQGLTLMAPFKSKKKDPWPWRSYQLSRPRYRTETVFSQLVERFQAKQVWARDIWHLQAWLLRKVLSHTLAFSLNQDQGNPPLQFDKLLAW